MRAILVETNRVRNLHWHFPNLGVDPERMKHLHEVSIEIGDGTRNQTQAPDFTASRHDIQLVIDEVNLYFEYSLLVGNGRRRKPSPTHIQRNFPPVVDSRTQRQAHFPHDL